MCFSFNSILLQTLCFVTVFHTVMEYEMHFQKKGFSLYFLLTLMLIIILASLVCKSKILGLIY